MVFCIYSIVNKGWRDEMTKRSYAALLFDEMICVAKIVPVLLKGTLEDFV